MTGRHRCDEIVRLIDEALTENEAVMADRMPDVETEPVTIGA